MTSRIILQPAFVLHARPFSDTSLIVDFFTQDYGRLSLLARGARGGRSPYRGLLMSFVPLLISWSGKANLPTLTKVEAVKFGSELSGKVLLSGFYLNELLYRLLERYDAHPKTFALYEKTIGNLAQDPNVEFSLRMFEKQFLMDIGYGLQLTKDINDAPLQVDANYFFKFGFGFTKTNEKAHNSVFVGKSILALANENFSSQAELLDAKRLMRIVFDSLLGEKPIKSREISLWLQGMKLLPKTNHFQRKKSDTSGLT